MMLQRAPSIYSAVFHIVIRIQTSRLLLRDLDALGVAPTPWRRQRFTGWPCGDLRAFRHSLRSEIFVILHGLEGSLEGPTFSISMFTWRTIDQLAELTDLLHGLVVEVLVTHDCITSQEVPEELVGACTTCNSLMDQEDQVTPCHRVQFEEVGDVLPIFEGIIVRTSLHDWPIVRCELEDLGPLLPFEVLVARMADLLEHPEAVERDVFHVSMAVPFSMALRGPGSIA